MGSSGGGGAELLLASKKWKREKEQAVVLRLRSVGGLGWLAKQSEITTHAQSNGHKFGC